MRLIMKHWNLRFRAAAFVAAASLFVAGGRGFVWDPSAVHSVPVGEPRIKEAIKHWNSGCRHGERRATLFSLLMQCIDSSGMTSRVLETAGLRLRSRFKYLRAQLLPLARDAFRD